MSSDGKPIQRVRVLKLMWSIYHYRVPILRRLCKNPHLDFTVCAGDNRQIYGGARIASAEDVGQMEGIKWRRLRSRQLRWFPFRDWEWQPEAVKIALTEDYDVQIIHSMLSLSNLLVRLICRLRGIPVIEWTQGVTRPTTGLKWLVKKLYVRLASACLFYGHFATDYFAARGFDRRRLFTVHNSLDHDLQVKLRERLTSEDIARVRERFGVAGLEDRLVFFSGRLERGKRVDLLLEALAFLRDRGRRVVGIVIGDGREEGPLREQADQLKLGDRAMFYGPCYQEKELASIISAADLCVVPREVGLVVMHSFVYGTPVLTCENSAWRHGPELEVVVEGKTGGLYRDGNVVDLADKMEAMLYPVPAKQHMRRACMRIIDEEYTPEYQERVIIQAINCVLPPERQLPVPLESKR